MYKEQALWGDVDSLLRDSGFTFHCWEEPMRRSFMPLQRVDDPYGKVRQIIWGDAWYARHFEDLNQLEPERLVSLAALLHDCLRSVDFAHRALRTADDKTGSSTALSYFNAVLGNSNTGGQS